VDDGEPGVGRLHDLDGLVDGAAQALFEVVGCAEAADEEDGFDGDFGGRDLVFDQLDHFLDDRLEDDAEVRGLEVVSNGDMVAGGGGGDWLTLRAYRPRLMPNSLLLARPPTGMV
jgi:hypothetical protein